MSNAVLKGNASGTGTVTLETPNTNTDRTISLPDAPGTVMVSGNMPAFSAYNTGGTSLGTAAFTKLVQNTKFFDTATCFNNTGSTVTLNGISVPSYSFAPNVAGYYQFNASSYIEGTANNSVIGLFKNGIGYSYGSGIATTSNPYYQISTLIYLNGTSDYVYAALYTGTSGLTTGSSSAYQFSGVLVRGA